MGLTGRTLGVIGFGNIGRDLVRLAEPFEMRVLVTTPRLTAEEAARHGVERVELETLLAEADVAVVACPLKPETQHLLDARRLAPMKPTAFLINVARGPIVDQAALARALREGRIAGAGLDVFEREPVDRDDPLLGLETSSPPRTRSATRTSCFAAASEARARRSWRSPPARFRATSRTRPCWRALSSRRSCAVSQPAERSTAVESYASGTLDAMNTLLHPAA